MKKITRLKHPVDVVCAIARSFDTSSTSVGVGIGEDEARRGLNLISRAPCRKSMEQ